MTLLRLWYLMRSPVGRVAATAVKAVMENKQLQEAAEKQPRIAFCPRCGQIPDGDRRMEEAREVFHAIWKGPQPKRGDLDMALAYAYYRSKRG